MVLEIKNEKWSEIQKECYERNCNCRGCEYKQYNSNCQVKKSLIEQIKKFGLESGVKTKQWLQTQKIGCSDGQMKENVNQMKKSVKVAKM